MYNSIIATDVFTLRGSHPLERMEDAQLADLGIEREGNVFLHHGKVVHDVRRFDLRTFLGRFASFRTLRHSHPARAKLALVK